MIEMVWEKIAQGGLLMAPIAALSFAAWVIIIERWLFLRRSIACNRKAHERLASSMAALDAAGLPASSAARALAASRPRRKSDFELAAWELRLSARAASRLGIETIGRLAATAPLIGLLGTVSGMICTFDAMAAHGSGNPRAMAEGISLALITTEAGLMAAIPAMLARAFLERMAKRASAWIDASIESAGEILFPESRRD